MNSEIAKLGLFVDEVAEQLDIAVETVAKKLAFDTWIGLVEKTPVDLGRAQSSWNLGIGDSDLSVPDEAVTYPTQPDFSLIDGTSSIFITSSLDYMEELENGHSDQAPYGMVAITAAEIMATIDVLLE